MKTKIVKDITDFTQSVEKDIKVYYFLEAEEGTISDYIENSGLEDDLLLELKVAYNFPVDAFLEDKRTEDRVQVESIVQIVEHLKENEETYFRVILKENDRKKLSDVIQQFIFLDMKSLDIVTEQELEEVARYQRLKKDKDDLKYYIEEFEKKVIGYATDNQDIQKDKKNLQEKIKELKTHLIEIEDRPLKICVMATKKSGKSVIVNSFFRRRVCPNLDATCYPQYCYL